MTFAARSVFNEYSVCGARARLAHHGQQKFQVILARAYGKLVQEGLDCEGNGTGARYALRTGRRRERKLRLSHPYIRHQ